METNIEVALYLLAISPNDAERDCGKRAAEEYDRLRAFADGMLRLVDDWNDTGFIDDVKVNALASEFRE